MGGIGSGRGPLSLEIWMCRAIDDVARALRSRQSWFERTHHESRQRPPRVCVNPTCGRTYQPIYSGQRYCSRHCHAVMPRGGVTHTIRQCAYCRKDFAPYIHAAKFCSVACNGKANRLPRRVCLQCGHWFQKKKNENKGACCCRTCGWAYQVRLNAARRALRGPVSAPSPKVKHCRWCTNIVVGRVMYCSDACRYASAREKWRAYGRKRARPIERVVSECLNCGVPLTGKSKITCGAKRCTKALRKYYRFWVGVDDPELKRELALTAAQIHNVNRLVYALNGGTSVTQEEAWARLQSLSSSR